LLTQVKEENLFGALGHETIDDYAEMRLNLGRASLFRYLQVYAWVRATHKEWLEPKVKGLIPDLSDVADLIHIEAELTKTSLSVDQRATLEALKSKALAGHLRHSETLRALPRTTRSQPRDGMKAFMTKLKSLRSGGAKLKDMPPEVINYLNAAIELLDHDSAMARIPFAVKTIPV
jgi:hypothetical protein